MVQQLHQMVLQESVPVHVQPVQALVVQALQQVPQLAEQLAVPELLQLAVPELPQPVEQLPLLSVQTLE
jgi:hypothetical protein